MIISSNENKSLYEQLINNRDNYDKFASFLADFNNENRQKGVRMPAAFITPTTLRIDDKCTEQFMLFLRNCGCRFS